MQMDIESDFGYQFDMQCDIVLLFSVSLNFLMKLLLRQNHLVLWYSICGLVWFGVLLIYVIVVFAYQYNYM